MTDAQPNIVIPPEHLQAFCRKWKIREFALFGSVLRDDFGPESDVDVLVSFQPDAGWSLWDLIDMQDDLQRLFGREVDLIEKEGLRNPFRRHEILTTRRVLYAA
ncbi:MAG TPA: nucleotidyltransferase family protein [Tepidisphaeraceae bacterium]|nr:nucleotidyltransferase family protein [Tepidisphaeraceae bacterium]